MLGLDMRNNLGGRLIVGLLVGLYMIGMSGFVPGGNSCCCKKAGGSSSLIRYCCLKPAAQSCDGKPGFSSCRMAETAKEFSGPEAALQSPSESAPIVRAASPHIQISPLPAEGFTALPERPPTLA